MNDKMLEIINVSKSFGNSSVINNINLTVYSGEVFGFLGPNGAGKSTTIKMITGLLPIDKGDILINGYSIKKNFENAIKNVGAIVDTPDLYDYLSGYDNLSLIARLYKIKKDKIAEIIKKIGLENKIFKKVKTYSLGMKQRLGLGMALIREPRLLILDEPTNGLDPEGVHDLRNVLKDLAHNKKVCVFVTSHILSEIEIMCDRVAIINKGQIIKAEKIDELLTDKENSFKKAVYKLTTQDDKKARAILIKNNYKLLDNDKIIIEISKEKVASVLELLSKNSISTYEVNKKKQTLEEAFLDLTSGGDIDD